MGIKDEIFDSFLERLKKEGNLQAQTIEELRKLWASAQMDKQETIMEAIQKGWEDVTENKESKH